LLVSNALPAPKAGGCFLGMGECDPSECVPVCILGIVCAPCK
jgi:hypothetical protein